MPRERNCGASEKKNIGEADQILLQKKTKRTKMHEGSLYVINKMLRFLCCLLFQRRDWLSMFLLQKETKRTKRVCIGNCFEEVVEPENFLF